MKKNVWKKLLACLLIVCLSVGAWYIIPQEKLYAEQLIENEENVENQEEDIELSEIMEEEIEGTDIIGEPEIIEDEGTEEKDEEPQEEKETENQGVNLQNEIKMQEEAKEEVETPQNEAEASPESEDELDYILGRPMTEEEILAQLALEPEQINGTVDLDVEIPSFDQQNEVSSTTAIMPAQYKATEKGLITSVKDQGNYGACWAFSTISAAETSMIKKGQKIYGKNANLNTDLSELHLAYFAYKSVADPLGNTKGDYTNIGSKDNLNMGGTNLWSAFTLFNWTGVADEKTLPYNLAESARRYNISNTLAYRDVAHLQNAYFISMKDIDEVKYQIMKYGSVASSYFHQNNFYNPETGAYNNPTIKSTNHSITVVGWDDNYNKNNFKNVPKTNGAWYIKNSWGKDWGIDGYFWISYEDLSIKGSGAVVYDFESKDNYDYIYQYDGTSGTMYANLQSGTKIANVYKAKKTTAGKLEQLKAISFAVLNLNTTYSIQIYKNLKDSSNPMSGTPMFDKPQIGRVTNAGYHTIPLKSTISLLAGETYSVVIQLKQANGGSIYSFIDANYYDNDNGISYKNTSKPGQSFQFMPQYRNTWYDLDRENASFRIKAYTKNINIVPASSVKLNRTSLKLRKGKTATLKATIAPTNARIKSLSWTSSNKKVAVVNSKGIVTARGNGIATITVRTRDGSNKSARCRVSVGYNIVYKLNKGKNHKSNPTLYYNEKITLRTPTRKGYKFAGWYTDSKYKKRIKVINKGTKLNYTLYAKWKK